MNLEPYITVSESITKLLDPMIEVVIHDIKKECICFIAGNLSKRKIGDPSLLDIDGKKQEPQLDTISYPKLNFDGKLIKSISIPIKENNQMKALLCINCDVSIFEQMQTLTKVFLQPINQSKPESMFKNDWQEKLHKAIHEYLQTKGWNFADLNNTKKKKLVNHLYIIHAFNEKNSVDYIAKILNMGRATIFKYLKAWRTT